MRMLFSFLMLLLMASRVLSHEFWIAPVDYVIADDQPIKAQLKIGQKFEGAVQRFFAPQFERFEVHNGAVMEPVTGRLGDDPAMSVDALGDGLLVVVHETIDSTLTYREGQKFINFVQHKGAGDLLLVHKSRGLPIDGFQETYRRFAKSLIAAGNGEGQDRVVGLRSEIVVLANPYTDDLSQGLPIQVLFGFQPRPGAFVEVFARQGGEVTVSSYIADDKGIAVIPVHADVEYLVDATLVLPLANDNPAKGAVWESLWASTTFRVPQR